MALGRFRFVTPEISKAPSKAENLESATIDSPKAITSMPCILTVLKLVVPRGSKKWWTCRPRKRRMLTF